MSIAWYRLFLLLYTAGIKVASMFNKKAKLWLKGRKNIFPKLQQAFAKNSSPVIWFHCASLGEFEQGKPLMEQIKNDYPAYKILLTFFSPSGYEAQHDSSLADYVFYLPLDGQINARRFLSIVKPKLAVFVKYEFWYFYLKEIKNKNIPLLLVSGIFRENQPFFKWYGNLHRTMLQCFSHIFLQDKVSQELLQSIHITNTTICGDTRVDRVVEVANNWQPIEKISSFCKNHMIIVAGSTWKEDDKMLCHYVNINAETRFIIAPHEIDENRLKDCLEFYKHSVLYSELLQHSDLPENINTIIIDNIGTLSRLYKYATVCFVGGAFGEDGVHNVLEAAVYRKPVVFGPVYDKYLEAVELEKCGAAFSVNDVLELENTFNDLLSNDELYKDACNASAAYIAEKTGATKQIWNYIEQNILK